MPNSMTGLMRRALNLLMPAESAVVPNSPNCMLRTTAGYVRTKALTLAGNGAQLDNAFTVVGMCEVFEIAAHVTEATDSTTLSNFKFEADDGGAQDDITAVVNASGIVHGGMIYKRGLKADAAVMVNPTQVRVSEASAAVNKRSFQPFFVTQKTGGVTSYIRLSYTGDANTDVDVTVMLRYRAHSHDGLITAV